MREILKSLVKFAGIKFHENAKKLIQRPERSRGRYISVSSKISEKDVFSNQPLLEDKYYYYEKCKLVDEEPVYETKFIREIDEVHVKERIINSVMKVLNRIFSTVTINTYKVHGLYLHKIELKFNDDTYSDSEKGEDYTDSKIRLLSRAIKYLNHMRYVHRKNSNKKNMQSDLSR